MNETTTFEIVERFNDAFNRHDMDAIMALISDDCVFDTTNPAPDGERFEGKDSVRQAWEHLFSGSPDATFLTEEIFACGDHCVVRWRYTWDSATAGHVRGVDVFRVQDGLVAEKLSYVKG